MVFRVRPGVRVYEDRGDEVNYSVGYELPNEIGVEYSDESRT